MGHSWHYEMKLIITHEHQQCSTIGSETNNAMGGRRTSSRSPYGRASRRTCIGVRGLLVKILLLAGTVAYAAEAVEPGQVGTAGEGSRWVKVCLSCLSGFMENFVRRFVEEELSGLPGSSDSWTISRP